MSQPEAGGPNAASPSEPPKTAAKILEAISTQLTAQVKSDADLSEILKTHILTTTPAKDSADAATKAILELATARTKAAKPEQVPITAPMTEASDD